MKWLVDASLASGLLIDDNNRAFEYVYPFDALYTILGGELPSIKHNALLPFALPETLDLRLKADVKVKNDTYKFRSTLDGRRFQVDFTEIKLWLTNFKRVILPFEIAHLELPEEIDIYVDVSNSSKIDSLKLNNMGIALDFDQLGLAKVLSIIATCPVDSYYIFGCLTNDDIKSLSDINNLIIQTNKPFIDSINGLTYIDSELKDITDAQYEYDQNSLTENCKCFTCTVHTRSYLHHLYKNTPILAVQLLAKHNLNSVLFK